MPPPLGRTTDARPVRSRRLHAATTMGAPPDACRPQLPPAWSRPPPHPSAVPRPPPPVPPPPPPQLAPWVGTAVAVPRIERRSPPPPPPPRAHHPLPSPPLTPPPSPHCPLLPPPSAAAVAAWGRVWKKGESHRCGGEGRGEGGGGGGRAGRAGGGPTSAAGHCRTWGHGRSGGVLRRQCWARERRADGTASRAGPCEQIRVLPPPYVTPTRGFTA